MTEQAQEQTAQDETINEDQKKESAPEKDPKYDKLFREKQNWKEKAVQMENKLKELNEQSLKANNQYKELYETILEENKKLKTDLSDWSTKEEQSMKLSSIKSELKKMGLREDRLETALRLADINGVKYDPENKLVLGAEEVAKRVKETLPEIFGTNKSGADHKAPDVNSGGWTKEKYAALSVADKNKHYADYAKSLGFDFKP